MHPTKQKVSPFIPLLVVFATTPLLGQLPTGSIVGKVYDRTGATVRGAQLVLNDTATGNPRDMSTSPEGSYEFLELRPGTYDLAVEAKGFRRTVERSIVVNVGLMVRLAADGPLCMVPRYYRRQAGHPLRLRRSGHQQAWAALHPPPGDLCHSQLGERISLGLFAKPGLLRAGRRNG
jgi:hypothetical protein